MRFRCSHDGNPPMQQNFPREYDAFHEAIAQDAAFMYCETNAAHDMEARIVVEPIDDEARALPGWKTDERGPYRVFYMRPRVEWDARESPGERSRR